MKGVLALKSHVPCGSPVGDCLIEGLSWQAPCLWSLPPGSCMVSVSNPPEAKDSGDETGHA